MSEEDFCTRCNALEELTEVEGYTGSPINCLPTAGYLCTKCLYDLGLEDERNEK